MSKIMLLKSVLHFTHWFDRHLASEDIYSDDRTIATLIRLFRAD